MTRWSMSNEALLIDWIKGSQKLSQLKYFYFVNFVLSRELHHKREDWRDKKQFLIPFFEIYNQFFLHFFSIFVRDKAINQIVSINRASKWSCSAACRNYNLFRASSALHANFFLIWCVSMICCLDTIGICIGFHIGINLIYFWSIKQILKIYKYKE